MNVASGMLGSWGCRAWFVSLILRSTRCEGGVFGLFVFVGWGVTKIASGQLELRLTCSGIFFLKRSEEQCYKLAGVERVWPGASAVLLVPCLR